jgi:cellulose biosynthesis protein BcsQ
VLLDTAPHADQASLRAARAADLVLIPVRCSILDSTLLAPVSISVPWLGGRQWSS